MNFLSTPRNFFTAQKKTNTEKRAFAVPAILALSILGATQATHGDIGASHSTLVSEFPSFNTPGVVDGRVEAIAIDGDTVYVGGTFTQIQNPLSDEVINQPYLFAYSKSTGQIIESFDPQLNNTVLALETTGDSQGGVFAGGLFGNLNGEFSRGRFAKIDINGDRVQGFSGRVDAAVKTMVRHEDTIYIGGNFSSISETPVERLAALDTNTGTVDANFNLDFGGLLFTTRLNENQAEQSVDDIDITSDGSAMVVIGNFETINGISRPRLAMLELNGQARVSTWNTDVFDVQCPAQRLPQYVFGVDIAPDDNYLIVGTRGFRRFENAACDTIGRYEIDDLNNPDVHPTWVNYTGGDSVFDVVATDHAVYAGGHFRWLNNDTTSNGNDAGPGSTARAGLAAIDPLNGLTLRDWQSDRNPRGVGVFAMISEPEGLYLGDDTDFQNGTRHQKLKFLPVGSETVARPDAPTLPTTMVTNVGDGATSGLNGSTFNGNTIGTATPISTDGLSIARAAMHVGGRLFYVTNSGLMRTATIDNGLSSDYVIDMLGLTEDNWPLSQLGGMFFDYEWSRVYYTLEGDSRLHYRAFSPHDDYFGNDILVAEEQGDIAWADVTSMDVIGGYLYFTRSDNNLYRSEINGASVISGTTEVIGGPAVDGRQWSNTVLAFISDGTTVRGGKDTNAEFEFQAAGDSDGQGRFQRFEFPVAAGEPVLLRLEWFETNANLRLFVRDSNNVAVASDATDGASPIYLNVPAGAGGTYIASVLVADGSTSYTLQINPFEAPPAPLADFEFSGKGSTTDGRWQVYRFDVEAGDLVEARVIWDKNQGDLNLFLRDETNSQVARDNDGNGSPALASTIATSSGTWSVGVAIQSGEVDYSVFIDTSN